MSTTAEFVDLLPRSRSHVAWQKVRSKAVPTGLKRLRGDHSNCDWTRALIASASDPKPDDIPTIFRDRINLHDAVAAAEWNSFQPMRSLAMPLTVAERVRRYRRHHADRVRFQCFITRRTRDQLDRARRHHGKTLAQIIEHAVDLLDTETLPPPAAQASAAARAGDRNRGLDVGRDHERTRGLDHGAYRLRETAHAGVPPPEPLSAPLAPPSSELETILASEMPDLPEPARAFLRRHGAAIVGPLRDGRVAAAAAAARARGLPQCSAAFFAAIEEALGLQIDRRLPGASRRTDG